MNKNLLLCLAACCTLVSPSAQAQCQSESQPQQSVQQTVSTMKIYGWEHALTQKDPSLNHWDWEPITTTIRGSRTAWGVTHPKAGSHYVKPDHIPPPNIDEGASNKGYRHVQTNLAGTLKTRHHAPGAVATYSPSPPVMASYSGYSQGSTSHNRALAKAEVLGQLVSR